jgi:aminopeptidase N
VRLPRATLARVCALILVLPLAGCHLFRTPPPEPTMPPWDLRSPPYIVPDEHWEEMEAVPIGIPAAPGRYSAEFDAVHYDIELVVPEENDRISVRTVIRYRRPDQRGAHALSLDFTGLAVEAVTVEGEPVPFVRRAGSLEIDHPGRIGIFDTLQVEVMARGVPADGLILRETVHGAPAAFADNWPNRARFWFPSIDHPSDKATVSFTVHAAEGRQVVANGILVEGPTPSDPLQAGGLEGLQRWRWEQSIPIPTYLMVVGVAEMEELDLGRAACGMAPASPEADGCIPINAWAFPPDTAQARAAFRRSAEMVDLYTQWIGPYPYEKLSHVQSSTRFGGMENASVIFYSERALSEGRDLEGTVAHEVAHQWFGNSVTPADWPHLWLSEGFASYFGPLFWESTEGDVAFQERMAAVRDRVLQSDVTDRPVVDETATNLLDLLNANSYQKGAMALHMLRGVMGDRAFFRGVREYYRRYAGRNVVTADFQRVMEETEGDSLDWFFRQWLHAPGYPQVRAEWSWNPSTRRASVLLRQEQPWDWPTFRFPIELAFVLDGGVHLATFWMEGREWSGSFSLPREPLDLRLDPEGQLLMQNLGVTRGPREE